MANEFARNIQDATLGATFSLPTTSSSSTTSGAIDLGADIVKPENVEIELSVPAVTTTMNPAAATAGITYIFESSTTSTFAAVARILASKNFAGSSGSTAAFALRARLPSDCERYIRGKVTFGTTTTDASTLTGTVSVRF